MINLFVTLAMIFGISRVRHARFDDAPDGIDDFIKNAKKPIQYAKDENDLSYWQEHTGIDRNEPR